MTQSATVWPWAELAAAGSLRAAPAYAGFDARCYDAVHDDKRADLAVYRRLLPEPARVLELGAGTGRVALALAAAGHEVTACDSSEDMLTVLRDKIANGAPAVSTATADMRELALGAQFDAVVIAHNTLAELETAAEREACLRACAEHVRPGGRLFVDVEADSSALGTAALDTLVRPFTAAGERGVQLWRARRTAPGQRDSEIVYLVLRRDGGYEGSVHHVRERFLPPGEVPDLLARCGLAIRGAHSYREPLWATRSTIHEAQRID